MVRRCTGEGPDYVGQWKAGNGLEVANKGKAWVAKAGNRLGARTSQQIGGKEDLTTEAAWEESSNTTHEGNDLVQSQ